MQNLTPEFANHLDKAVKKSFDNYSKDAFNKKKYPLFLHVYDTTEYEEGFTSDEGVERMGELTEDGEIKQLKELEGYKVSLVSKERGASIKISKKMILRSKDTTTLLKKYVAGVIRKLNLSAHKQIEVDAHDILNNAFTTTLAPDLNPMIGSHTFKNNGATFDNQITGNPLFGATAWDLVKSYGGDFEDANGDKWMIDFNTVVVKAGSANERAARRLFPHAKRTSPATDGNINIYEMDDVRLIATPHLKSSTAWFATDSNFEGERSAVLKFVQRPQIEPQVIVNNGSREYPIISSYEAGLVNLPIDWVGSLGDLS